jgi:hypothetical protein
MNIDRRSFFAETARNLGEVLAIPEAQSVQETHKKQRTLTSGLAPFAGTWDKKQVRHLLKRTLFGVSQQDLQNFSGMTASQAVDALLNPGSMPNPPINNYNNRNFTDPDVAAGSTWVNANYSVLANGLRRISFKAWWMEQIIKQQPNIREKMTLFWHNHFATESDIIGSSQLLYIHHNLLRQHALGNFKTLVSEVTKNAAMLIYLNGDKNTKTAPDENYARELQELFTLGKGPDSKYTEADVKAAARVLTGWRVERTGVNSYFDSTRHDTTNKVFSSYYGSKTITGKTGTAGATETDELIDMIFLQEEVSKHICRKLYRYFIYYDIDAAAETNVIVPLAKIFRDNNFEIKPVLRALFLSEHFFDDLNKGCFIKTPSDFMAGMIRQYNLTVPETTLEIQYNMYNTLRGFGALLLEDLADPPNVAGWPAYYQEPMFYELWINSDTLPKRNQLSDLLISVGYKFSGATLVIDALAFANSFSTVTDINAFIDDVIFLLYPFEITKTQKDYLKSILLSGQSADYYWTDVWNTYKSNPGNTANTNYVNGVLRLMLKAIMNLAEYQLN